MNLYGKIQIALHIFGLPQKISKKTALTGLRDWSGPLCFIWFGLAFRPKISLPISWRQQKGLALSEKVCYYQCMPKGGQRPGSGRKPDSDPRSKRTLNMPASFWRAAEATGNVSAFARRIWQAWQAHPEIQEEQGDGDAGKSE